VEYEDEEELAQCPNCGAIIPADALVCPECGVEFEVEDEEIESEEDVTKGLGEDLFEDENEFDDEMEGERKMPGGKVLFPAGLILSILGLGGVAGLRAGIVQSIMGINGANASQSIGSREWTGIIVSLVIFAVGLVLIWMWGNSED